ncbi:MAG: hypothetical protein J4203_05305 [Candidatus Diapherotrites archaeon]|uniref:Uncharacterized protein n=1 Tax=Candidatus Iainarchaeum sp. TaxID=3101447 RepID=A0A8T4L9A5_9ARCH|nr:hypothetical protein [Candidatus Diapherotrites archaeon]
MFPQRSPIMAKPARPEIKKPRQFNAFERFMLGRAVRRAFPTHKGSELRRKVEEYRSDFESEMARVRYVPKKRLRPMGFVQRWKARKLIDHMEYPLPAGAPEVERELVARRLTAAKTFLRRLAADPLTRRALFDAFHTSLLKTITAELSARDFPTKTFVDSKERTRPGARRFRLYSKEKSAEAGGKQSQLHLYARPVEGGYSELAEHELTHLAICMEALENPHGFTLSKRQYSAILVRVRRILGEHPSLSAKEFYSHYAEVMR